MSYNSRYQQDNGRSRGPPRDYRDHDRGRDYHPSLPQRPPSRGSDSYRPPSRENRENRSGRFSPYRFQDRDRDRDRDRDQDYRRQDSWSSRNGPSHAPPPPPRHPQPPPPPGDPARPPQGDFTFRFDKPPGVDDASYDSYRPGDNRPPPNGPQARRNRAGGRQGAQRGTRGRGRGGFGSLRFLAANRPILQGTHSMGPEQAYYDVDAEAMYRPLDDVSDSEEADMEISGDESDASNAPDASQEPSSKRARLGLHQSASDSNAPKWSNPDPYTALPPPDATQQKKKDVVQLIRKARVQTKEAKTAISVEAEEFISCDFDDSDSGTEEVVKTNFQPASAPPPAGAGVPGAPTGPRNPNLPANLPRRPDPPEDSPNNFQKPTVLEPTQIVNPSDSTSNTTAQTSAFQPGPTTKKLAAAKDLGTSALGSRKRTHDDRIILPAHAKLKKATSMPSGGSLTWEWEIKRSEDSCPWLVADHSRSANMGVWLHKEIMDFYEYVKPQDFEQRIRQQLVQELKTFCRSTYKDAEVYPFGSFPSGLYLPTGDMDLVLCSDSYLNGGRPKYGTKTALFRLRANLQHNRVAHRNEFELILHAKVPLVKYIDRRTGLKMDVSFENLTGLTAIDTFLAWKEQYPAMPILVTLVKHFLMMRGLNEPVNGGIGGFSVTCLVVSMMQMMPEVQSRSMNTAHHLGDLLMEFFDLYGNRFNYKTTAISLNPPKYIPKNHVTAFAYKHQDRLSIIDPNNPGNDIAGGSSNTATILSLFSKAHSDISATMRNMSQFENMRQKSLLSRVYAGNYSTFQTQRAHLLKLSKTGLPSDGSPTEDAPTQW